jgi:1-deoxy-D-xylulose-5-phosphate synthase
VLITLEEGAAGGFGALVMQHLAWRGLLETGLKFRPMTLPDRPIDHDTQAKQYEAAGLDAPRIVATVLAALGQDGRARQARSSSRKMPLARTN